MRGPSRKCARCLRRDDFDNSLCLETQHGPNDQLKPTIEYMDSGLKWPPVVRATHASTLYVHAAMNGM